MKKIVLFILLSITPILSFSDSQIIQPKLIVQIVVDQLRGDLIHKHQHQFSHDGFNYLLNHSLDFQNAHHPHANTTTCAGHATIATGSYPAMHGVVDNEWFDRNTRQLMYCMSDAQVKPLPTIHTKSPTEGRSPRNLSASTVSDEIILATKGRAFGVSLKDRSAITLAGHAGKAFWFDRANGGFITTSYYYASYPKWVDTWNKEYHPQPYEWKLSRPKSSYINANAATFHHADEVFGQTFPHHVTNPPSVDYFKSLARTPKADELTADFAIQLLKQEKLGLNPNQTDYLGVSFSATDAIAHQFGPNSLEAEENLIQLDKTLARLISTIDQQVGLKNTLIVLTADHGVSDTPAYLMDHHITEIEPINIESTSTFVKNQLMKQFKLPPEALMSITPPYIYLDHKIIEDHQIKLEAVNQYLANLLSHQPGIFKAFALPLTCVEKDWLSAKVDHMAYPYRAGDVYLVQPPYQSYGEKNPDRVAHGSPWQYDSYVPLIFSNPGFKPQRISRPVTTTDIAPTLSAILMIKPPSAAVGQPLTEVMKSINKEQNRLKPLNLSLISFTICSNF
jgi:predicted AlkP superfamily pyrophosphatase or phosphodiesterase